MILWLVIVGFLVFLVGLFFVSRGVGMGTLIAGLITIISGLIAKPKRKGEPATETKSCVKCGAWIPANSTFCTKCGASQEKTGEDKKL